MPYTLYNFGNPKQHISLPPRHSRCVTQRVNGDCDTHAQSRRQDYGVKGTWLLYLGSNDCGRAEIGDCDVCWLPNCHPVAFHCPKLCRALPEASHLTCLWTGIINHHLAVLSQESDCCPPAFSVVKARKLFVMNGSYSVRLSILCILTHLPSLFSQWSRASSSVPYSNSV